LSTIAVLGIVLTRFCPRAVEGLAFTNLSSVLMV
jgi:hypothetical protein